MPSIWTIGHSTRTLEELIGILQAHKITALADVRSFPASRRYPHFDRANLEAELPRSGMAYRWLGGELGGYRRKIRDDSPHTALRSPGFRHYADYLATAEFEAGIEQLLGLAVEKRVALMCAERLWWRCHRSLIADYLTAVRGVEVIHILEQTKSEPHRLHRVARIAGGRLVYDVGEVQPLL